MYFTFETFPIYLLPHKEVPNINDAAALLVCGCETVKRKTEDYYKEEVNDGEGRNM
jgi:hypothetical protein